MTHHTYADEARARWGQTEAFRESQRRAAAYEPADWAAIRTEAAAIESRLAAAMHEGWPPDSDVSMDLAEEHRRHLSHWFYDCSPGLHSALGDTYVEDERFASHYDERAAGLASYVCAAIHANAARQELHTQ